jgi:hypothetical protein
MIDEEEFSNSEPKINSSGLKVEPVATEQIQLKINGIEISLCSGEISAEGLSNLALQVLEQIQRLPEIKDKRGYTG